MAVYELSPLALLRTAALAMGGEMRPRLKEGVPKLSPDGRPTYASGVVVARDDGGVDRNVTIAVIELGKFPLGMAVRPDGKAWLTPYVTDAQRLGISIVCERLIPVKAERIVPPIEARP